MADDLKSIDISHLDALAKLEADQRAIRALSEKAAWHRDTVVEVYSRVVRDYETREKALDDQARSIRERVRQDLRTLDALHDRCGEAVDQAKVELQESEFRHEIGEFTREEFQKRQQVAERTIGERQEEFESVKNLRARYLELLPAEAAAPSARMAAPVAEAAAPPVAPSLPTPPAPPPPAASAPVAPDLAPVVTAPTPPPAGLHPADTVPSGAVAAVPIDDEEPIPPADGATSFLAPPTNTDFQVPLPAKAPSDSEAFGTVAISAAMLVEDRSGLPGAHHRLGLSTSIGRTPDNQIVVPVREVSRRHAEVVLTENGYVVKDLGSPNGTFVNGERITEHRLQDEDRIAMGGQVFVFKAR